MPVRTTRLAAVKATTTLATAYTVPAAKTAIIKWVSVEKFATGADTLTVTVLIGATAYGLLIQVMGIGATVVNLPEYWVLKPTDQLRVQTASATIGATFFGSLLDGSPP